MTQQFDLAFKTSNTMDKMMSNTTTSSFSLKDNNNEIGTQFGSFLENANKNYSTSSKNNDSKTENRYQQKKEDKTNFVSGKSDDSNAKNFVSQNNDNVKNDIQNNEQSIKDSGYAKFEEKDVKAEQANLQSNEVVSAESFDEEVSELIEEPLNEVLMSLSTLPNIDIVLNFEAEAELKTENLVLLENDIPADALKSSISFDTVFANAENVTKEELNVVEDLTKDVVASKEDYISAMYKSKEIGDNTNSVQPKAELAKDANIIKTADVKADMLKEDVVAESVPQVALKVENVMQDVEKAQDSTNSNNQNVEVKLPLKNEEVLVAEKEPEMAVKEVTLDSSNDIKSVTSDVEIKSDTKIQLNKDEKQNPHETENNKTEKQVEVPKNNVQVEEHKMVETVVVTDALKQNVKLDNAVEQPQTKDDVLKQELTSAKLENSANLAQDNNNSKEQAPDEFAKTNVDAKERMNIKDDVKGIEFVNNKFEEKQEVKSEDNKLVQDVKEEQVKQKVEQVKIQIEDNVKVQPQVKSFTSDENKMLRANETLEKAGLSTENLQKMDAKIKEVDKSAKTYQTDLGQSSREVLMRDVMQNNAAVQNSEAVELKVDFNQELNAKLTQSNNLQMPQQSAADVPEINILEQIRAKMALNAQNGMQKITIGLTPESLGKLNIEISKGQNGISAQIIADNPQAKEILDKNLDGLKSVLQSQGVNINNVNVKVAEAGRSSDSNNNMFNKEDGQFDSNNNGNHSRNDEESEKEKRSAYEFLQKEAIKNEILEEPEQIIERTMQTERTISVKSGFGNVSYKL